MYMYIRIHSYTHIHIGTIYSLSLYEYTYKYIYIYIHIYILHQRRPQILGSVDSMTGCKVWRQSMEIDNKSRGRYRMHCYRGGFKSTRTRRRNSNKRQRVAEGGLSLGRDNVRRGHAQHNLCIFTLVSRTGRHNLCIFTLVSHTGRHNLCIFTLVSRTGRHYLTLMSGASEHFGDTLNFVWP